MTINHVQRERKRERVVVFAAAVIGVLRLVEIFPHEGVFRGGLKVGEHGVEIGFPQGRR